MNILRHFVTIQQCERSRSVPGIYKFYFTFIKCYQSINDLISFLWCIKKFLKICQQTDQIRMVQWEHANCKIHSFILENFIPPLAIPWIIFSLCIGVRGVELLLRAVRGTSHNYIIYSSLISKNFYFLFISVEDPDPNWILI